METDGEPDAEAGARAGLRAAEEIVARWSRTCLDFTGVWLDERDSVIGVGIAEGDDIGTEAHLQELMPDGVRARVRLVTAEWARRRQLQVYVFHYLIDEAIWGRYAVGVGVDNADEHVKVDLLPITPDSVATQIRSRFPTHDLELTRNASQPIAV